MNADQRNTSSSSSSYESLVNLCYQLRHENQELMEAVNLKSVFGDTCEREIASLRERLRGLSENRSKETEESLEERMQLSEDRLRLLKEKGEMDQKLRESEIKVSVLTSELSSSREQVEILLNQLNESLGGTKPAMVVEASSQKLMEENQRLKRELENCQFLLAKITPTTTPPSPSSNVVMSSQDSLLRLFESIVGYSAVRSGDILTLVSHLSDGRTKFRFRISSDNVVLLQSDSSSSDQIEDLKPSFTSIPAFLAENTLREIKNSSHK